MKLPCGPDTSTRLPMVRDSRCHSERTIASDQPSLSSKQQRTSARSAGRATLRPAQRSTDEAEDDNSDGKSDREWWTFTPIPTTKQPLGSFDVSTRTPAIFLAERTHSFGHFAGGSPQGIPALCSRAWTSFGHLTPVHSTPFVLAACTTEHAAINPSAEAAGPAHSSVLRSTEHQIPSPGSEIHLRPRLPRPAVWCSAVTIEPWGAPAFARREATSIVVVTEPNAKCVRPRVRVTMQPLRASGVIGSGLLFTSQIEGRGQGPVRCV